MSDRVAVLTAVAALGCAVVAGVFFAFSTFVMDALGRLPAPQGIEAMQSVNVTAVTPAFMALLFGTALACVGLVATAPFTGDRPGAALRVGAGVVYLVGVIALTIAYHVPHNDALATLDPTGAGSAAEWRSYLSGWTAWNHVRTLSSLASAVLLVVAAGR